MSTVCKKLSNLTYLFSQIKDYLTLDAKHMFYNSYFLPSIDYCITTWGFVSKENVDRVFKYQKCLGRMILQVV